MRILGWPAFRPDTGNPYNGLLYGAIERRGAVVDEFSATRLVRGHYDVWHIHWPERIAHGGAALVRLAAFAALVVWSRLSGTRIVWTVHNLEGHAARRPGLERGFMRWFARRLDGVVCLSETGVSSVRERYPSLSGTPAAVVALGHYVDRYPNEIGRDEARAKLGLAPDDRVVAFVGRITPYRNVERLIGAFRGLEEPGARLVVAGLPASSELGLALERAAGDDRRIRLRLADVPDEELQVVLNAADLVVLPFERILNSSSALLALGFGRPVLVPATGAMGDLQDELGTDAVRLFPEPLGPDDLAAALAAPAPDAGELIARVRSAHDWDAIAAGTLSLYAEATR